MNRLFIISNRVSNSDHSASGGLASAMEELLQKTGGVWFGWSGKIAEDDEIDANKIHIHQEGSITRITVDLTQEEHDGYYYGFSNDVIWPVFHNRIDLSNFNKIYYEKYIHVNKLFAREILPFLEKDDVIWVHDYHLIPLASELRSLHCQQRIGFFLHIPLPPPIILRAIPEHQNLIQNFFDYDLVGFQTQRDASHFSSYINDNKEIISSEKLNFQAFPIGIDVENFIDLSLTDSSRETYSKIKQEYPQRRIILGVDRLDYSKGLKQRVLALKELFCLFPENKNYATLIQVGSPTRENNPAYVDLREDFESLCGAINGDYGELDWVPVRYLHQTLARENLAGLYRAAHIGLVTPLLDGMNLVAKEYVAAQDPADPGVLILSQFAGAAEQLKEALLVNPYDIHGTARTLQQAIKMSLAERIERHQALLQKVQEENVHWWANKFLTKLKSKQFINF